MQKRFFGAIRADKPTIEEAYKKAKSKRQKEKTVKSVESVAKNND
jgi:hypothetical protein